MPDTFTQFPIRTYTRRLVIESDRWIIYNVAPDGTLTTIAQELPNGDATYLQLRHMGGIDTGLSVGAGGDALVYHSGAPGTATPGSPNPLNP